MATSKIQLIYQIENLHCPKCAVRIEEALQQTEGVEAVTLSFATRQLYLTTANSENMLEQMQAIANQIDGGVRFLEQHHKHSHPQKIFTCNHPNCNCCAYDVKANENSISGTSGRKSMDSVVSVKYDVKNIDCANCAAKIEAAVQKLDCVQNAQLSYASGLLTVTADAGVENLLEQIQSATDSVEFGVSYQLHEIKSKSISNIESVDTHKQNDNTILIIGAVLFVTGILIEWLLKMKMLSDLFLLAAYLCMGWKVLSASVRNISKLQIFDENFLMSIATIGAICIGSLEEAAGVMLFFRIGELFEHLAVTKSRESVIQAIDMRPETVQKIVNQNQIRSIPAEQVRIGDRLMVRAGDRIPVDGIIRKGESTIDTSAMTGESVPVSIHAGDTVMSGGMNLTGMLELEATSELKDSMITRILESVENAAAGKPKIDKFITRFASIYTPIVVIIAIVTAIIPSLITGNWSYWVYTALNFLMISCPCALVLSVPLAFFTGIGAASARGILFKDSISLETLTLAKAVVFDKTGTLTKGCFTVSEIQAETCTPEMLLKLCAACENASSHPIAGSILQYVQEQHIIYDAAGQVQELAGRGIKGIVRQQHILCGNEKFMQSEQIAYPKDTVAGTVVYIASDGIYCGRIILSDIPKENAEKTISVLHQKGLHTAMLTGDSSRHTQHIAEKLHIQETHAGLLPDEKLSALQNIRTQHGAVVFVGDGINDTPVLCNADVGAAIGNGAASAIEAADMILLGTDPYAVVTAIEIANLVNRTVKICVGFALTVKLLIMVLGFAGFSNMWMSVLADTGVMILCILFVLVNIYKRAWVHLKK